MLRNKYKEVVEFACGGLEVVQVYDRYHVKVAIWKRRSDKYTAAVKDREVVDKLRYFDNQRVVLRIRDIVLNVRLNYHEITGSRYIVFFLPKSLNPTWAKLHSEDNDVDAEIIVPREATNELEVFHSYFIHDHDKNHKPEERDKTSQIEERPGPDKQSGGVAKSREVRNMSEAASDDVDTSLINMFKVLDCLAMEFAKTAKPVNYTAIKSCIEEKGLHGSRYIYAALKKARDLGYVRFIERKSGGTWMLYIPTMRGIVAINAFNLAFMYRVPELYTLIMDYMVAWVRASVEIVKKWKEIMDREGINYNRNYIENVIRIGERILSAFKEDAPTSPEELSETMKYIHTNMDTVFRDWFKAFAKELENAGVPKEIDLFAKRLRD